MNAISAAIKVTVCQPFWVIRRATRLGSDIARLLHSTKLKEKIEIMYCQFCKIRQAHIWQGTNHQWCILCSENAVTTVEQLNKISVWMIDKIKILGLPFLTGTTKIRFLDSQKFLQHVGNSSISGLAQTWSTISFDGQKRHSHAEIFIQLGTPAVYLLWTLSHELAHVIASQQNYRFRDLTHEEGFCQAVAYAVVRQSTNDQAKELIDREWASSDPVYGKGMRDECAIINQIGWLKYLNSNLGGEN